MNFSQKIAFGLTHRSHTNWYPKSHLGLGLTLLSSLGLAAIATPASALTFTKLLELGQKVPGNDQPVTAIVEPTIGLDGQVAVKLTTQTVTTPTAKKAFSGIYAIPKGSSLKLLEGGVGLVRENGIPIIPTEMFSVVEFSEPNISSGKIAYSRLIASYDATGKPIARSSTIRVGNPGNVRTALTLPSTIGFGAFTIGPSQAFVNGKFYFLSAPSVVPSGSRFPLLSLNVVDTQAASPSITILNDNNPRYNGSVHASANTIILGKFGGTSGGTSIYESAGDANFKQITGCQVASVSHESIAFRCGDGALKVRFGRQGQIFTLPLGDNVYQRASLSNRSVLYVRNTPKPPSDPNGNTVPPDDLRLYLSTNGQPPMTLLKTGDQLSGKIVASMSLNFNGRTLAGNFAVCVVQFTDKAQALYRIDL
jgi:hypothetical protein